MELLNFGRLLISLIMLLSPLSWPNGYEVKMGQGYTLCEDMRRQLAQLRNPKEMVCNIQFNAKYDDFERVEWKSMNVEDNIWLVEQMDKYAYQNHRSQVFKGKNNPELTKDEWVEDFKWRLNDRGDAQLKRARTDLNNDSEQETILGYRAPSGGCSNYLDSGYSVYGGVGYHLFWYNEDKKEINFKKTDLMHSGSNTYEIFRYGKTNFLFKTYYMTHDDTISIYVYEYRDDAEPPRRSQRCEITKTLNYNSKGEGQ